MKSQILKSFLMKISKLFSDKIYLKIKYRQVTGNNLNLKNPKTFNEKIQWLKLYARKNEQISRVDKYKVRAYISETIGSQYLVPLIGVFDNVEDIDWDSFPNKFVLKCTHGSGSNIVCTNKSELNIKETKKKLKKWMKSNWYWYGREWPYKSLKPKIICEEYLGENIVDYKFMCFHGEPKLIQIHQNRGMNNQTLDFYNERWEKTNISRETPTDKKEIAKPDNFEEMLSIAKKLSQNEIHVRIDLYEVKGKIYFGEITYFTTSGFAVFGKREYDELLGEWIKLPT
ncbi:ATP-grasp fold amidoligase family protein [Marinococcus halophilus]|uniref:ATP-grasp fold amidoligase family protein n=1 Tax=Marinococcus halophilus TaxID=1371 RepID=UPI001C4DDBFB|nr:ATP-grasp fold amidoligase family protein [Marinococcus halophilus]